MHHINHAIGLAACMWLTFPVNAQEDDLVLAQDEFSVDPELLEDTEATISAYEPLNQRLGGDSIRECGGYGCIGWVEDHYPNGTLKHRGYYNDGQSIIYRNYFSTGILEREFKVVDNVRAVMRTYHANGNLCSEIKYRGAEVDSYVDHYRNGNVRYEEEKHKSGDYYERMNLFASNGDPISTMQLVDKKHAVFLQREYHPGRILRAEGKSQFNPDRRDTQRIGTWVHYDTSGDPIREDHYVDGMVHESKPR